MVAGEGSGYLWMRFHHLYGQCKPKGGSPKRAPGQHQRCISLGLCNSGMLLQRVHIRRQLLPGLNPLKSKQKKQAGKVFGRTSSITKPQVCSLSLPPCTQSRASKRVFCSLVCSGQIRSLRHVGCFDHYSGKSLSVVFLS